jgi:hypothetical protein
MASLPQKKPPASHPAMTTTASVIAALLLLSLASISSLSQRPFGRVNAPLEPGAMSTLHRRERVCRRLVVCGVYRRIPSVTTQLSSIL